MNRLFLALMLVTGLAVAGELSSRVNPPPRPISRDTQPGLTCTCHGGPGGYPYACAPIQKTCYGGPGYYPYSCSVCP